MAYRIYLTDSLFYQAQNQRLTTRYADLLKPVEVDDRDEDEIILDVMKNAGLRFKA